ncbi:MAG: hypothetical protein AAB356_04755 [Deltaproteobacteria bacterium]
MTSLKKMIVLALLVSFALLPARRAIADETMNILLKDTAYGGIIGALVGSAFVLLADKPGDHMDYIPRGAGVGLLAGAAYGIATSGLIQSAAEINGNKVAFHVPSLKMTERYDRNANAKEFIESIDLLSYRY